jgi:hypothetical protein
MDVRFCQHYVGDGKPPSNRFCRRCPHSAPACDLLWGKVVELSRSGGGTPVSLPPTNASLLPNPSNPNIVYLKVNARWNLGKEDFLHYISTGHAKGGRATQRQNPATSPSLTRQEPYVGAIVQLLGGWRIPGIEAVLRVQKGK